MSKLDFFVPSELFVKSKSAGWTRNSLKYRRFDSLASAVKFAMDEYGANLNGTSIHTNTCEYTGSAIRSLYENEDYPLEGRYAVLGGAKGGAPSASRNPQATSHKFNIGDTVIYLRPGLVGQSGYYEVVKVLPVEHAEPAYRIKSKSDQHVRAVKEREITPA
ncbi:hypothetical protein AB4037_10890 [Labrys sp. KB_33_2]|uniref:hypothetical protein n=1 Tax=Labrys sp. KB_33_2 TaxID=3237479 RepID=UPI003F927BEF